MGVYFQVKLFVQVPNSRFQFPKPTITNLASNAKIPLIARQLKKIAQDLTRVRPAHNPNLQPKTVRINQVDGFIFLNNNFNLGIQSPGKPRIVIKSNTAATKQPLTSGGSVGRRSTISYETKTASNEKTNMVAEIPG